MKSNSLDLEGYPCCLGVEAESWNGSVEFTLETGAYLSVQIQTSEAEKLRDFLNDFLKECDDIERHKEERAGL